jgi:hypothetical protein
MHKAALVILVDIDGEEFADPEPGAQERGDECVVP